MLGVYRRNDVRMDGRTNQATKRPTHQQTNERTKKRTPPNRAVPPDTAARRVTEDKEKVELRRKRRRKESARLASERASRGTPFASWEERETNLARLTGHDQCNARAGRQSGRRRRDRGRHCRRQRTTQSKQRESVPVGSAGKRSVPIADDETPRTNECLKK